jgi:outer membrane protein TolC
MVSLFWPDGPVRCDHVSAASRERGTPQRRPPFVRAVAADFYRRIAVVAATCLLLGGCATYAALPLPSAPDLQRNAGALMAAPENLPLREMGLHRFNIYRPLDIDDVATIAVAHNPALRALRLKVGVAEAQAFQAGLLPNPQFSFDYGFFVAGPGLTNSTLIGIAQDILPLLTLSARKAGAAGTLAGVELDLLWQEWQVVSQARTLFVRAASLRQQLSILQRSRQLFQERYGTTSTAMNRGDETLQTVTPDLVALRSAESQQRDLEQLILKNKHDLNALLGLLPETELALAGLRPFPRLDGRTLGPILEDLASRRPDLLALRAGYGAEEERVRISIIEQFPKLSIGSNNAKDTSAVYTQSIALTVSLPLFDRNQGKIAIERATREQLRAEYQARLDEAYSAAARLVSEIQLLERQYDASRRAQSELNATAATMEAAFQAKNIDERTYIDLRFTLLAQELATAKLSQAILEQRVTLQTLIGSHLPSVGARFRRTQ